MKVDSVFKTGLACLTVTTINGEEPTCEVVFAPEGCTGIGLRNTTKVPGRVCLQKGDKVLYDSGEYVEKQSGMTIKIRGNTSAVSNKKPYKIKLQKKADLLCRGDGRYADKDWVLLKTGTTLNNMIGFWLSKLMGMDWTPGFEYVNLVVNGDYRGVYTLTESV